MDWATLVMLYVFDSLNKPAHNSHSFQDLGFNDRAVFLIH